MTPSLNRSWRRASAAALSGNAGQSTTDPPNAASSGSIRARSPASAVMAPEDLTENLAIRPIRPCLHLGLVPTEGREQGLVVVLDAVRSHRGPQRGKDPGLPVDEGPVAVEGQDVVVVEVEGHAAMLAGDVARTWTAPPRGVGSTAMDARILLVEDDPSIREVTAMGLRAAGFEVDTAADGVAGLEKWRNGRARPRAARRDAAADGRARGLPRDPPRIDDAGRDADRARRHHRRRRRARGRGGRLRQEAVRDARARGARASGIASDPRR